MKRIFIFLTFNLSYAIVILTSSCASYNYMGPRRGENNSVSINVDNVADFSVNSNLTILSRKDAENGHIKILFQKILKNPNLVISHPIYDSIRVDLIREMRKDWKFR
jgi:hypothetical protein